ncbi:MAG: hypothetical protein R3E13_11035 [Alphaproteobacteria bacterium]
MALYESAGKKQILIQFGGASDGNISFLRGETARAAKVETYEVNSKDGSMSFQGNPKAIFSAIQERFKDDQSNSVTQVSGGTDGSAVFVVEHKEPAAVL